MRRSYITTVLALAAVLSMLVVPCYLEAQTGEKFVDFRGRAYSVEDLEKALFSDVPSDVRTRGIGRLPQAAPPQPPVLQPEKAAVALNVFFETNSDKVISKYHADLDKLGEVLKRHAEAPVEIAGHTDSVGSDQYNQLLSERRAASIKRYLMENFAISAERLMTRGYGESQPRATNDTPQGRSVNRRVEVVRVVK
jgi:outer membrane protein OmpA-like peptidoglycan-associated protein